MDKKYAVIEFKGSLEVVVVCAKWLTPRKKEVFWPPYKENGIFMRALKKQEMLDPKIWKLHEVERIFYETDDLDEAFKKRKKAELTSNLDTDSEKDKVRRRRSTTKKLAFDGCSSNSDAENTTSSKLVQRPKKIITPPIARRRSSLLSKSNSSVSTKSTNGEEDEFSHDVRTTSRQPISNSSTSLTPRSINTVRASTNNTPAEKNSTLSKNHPRDEVGQDVRLNEKDFCLLLGHVLKIKEQNKQILGLLTEMQPVRQIDPIDFPYDLPLKSYDDTPHLTTLGGNGAVGKTNRILKHLISDLVASEFNYFGSRSNKKPFYKLEVKKIILCE
ncbi:hypothetical protein ALC62_13670 [Cyphomyrmex costatus]|uniref:DUF4806 domain-containing protein n=1 Tax=Cyphomyrmex costatus TaxID=456900 RepID=A0A151I9D4_9HYME|nr:hypothetical protein ALC62_13670 [Cyphomyrmex costatus]